MGLPGFSASHSTMQRGLSLFTVAVVLFSFTGSPASEKAISVALFPFIPMEGSPTPLERTLYDLLAARIGGMTTARQVAPEGLARSASESGVDLESPYTAEQAAAVAARAGATVVVLGRTRKVEEELVIVARVFGVGGSGNEEILVSGSTVGRIALLLTELVDGIAGTLGSNPERFAGVGTDTSEVMAAFQERTAGLDRPTVFLQVREIYDGKPRPEAATEAELVNFLEAVGLEHISVKNDAEVIIFAHAVGEPGTGGGALMNSEVKVELRAVAPLRGELLAVAAADHRAADIFAVMEGTRAFSEATASLAPEFILAMVKAWNSTADRPR